MYQKILKTVGYLCSAYGLGAVVLSKFVHIDQNPLWWGTVAASVVGGLGLTYLAKFDLMKYWPKRDNSPPPTNDRDGGYYANMQNLDALSRSFKEKEDKEGLTECTRLHALLFKRKYLD